MRSTLFRRLVKHESLWHSRTFLACNKKESSAALELLLKLQIIMDIVAKIFLTFVLTECQECIDLNYE